MRIGFSSQANPIGRVLLQDSSGRLLGKYSEDLFLIKRDNTSLYLKDKFPPECRLREGD